MNKKQTCPYCGFEEEDCNAQWEEGSEVEFGCSSCGNEYFVEPVYEFLGFKVQAKCIVCGESDEDCYCEGEEPF